MPPMSTIRKKKQLITQLVRAARGQWAPPASISNGADGSALARPTRAKLPCFPLQRHHFGRLDGAAAAAAANGSTGTAAAGTSHGVATPSDFHSYLCTKIENAQERVVLASLYIGVGSNITLQTPTPIESHATAEDQLLQSLQEAASKKNVKKVQVLLDHNRALRKVSITKKNRQSHGSSDGRSKHDVTSSAEAVHSRINPYLKKKSPNSRSGSGLFLFPVNDKRLCTILPSPLDEVAGVFHIKAYIVDDELILSGANLSEEYFSNRLDRYMLFVNGGGGLVDFYADLCDILCEYAIRYEGRSNNKLHTLFSLQDEKARKEQLELSLMNLFNGENKVCDSEDSDPINPSATPVVAYAVPTFQMPTSFLGRQFRFQSDAEVTRNLLLSALGNEQPASIRLSSAYLNLTPKMMSVITRYRKEHNKGAPYILTAGTISHGFAPKAGSRERKAGIVDKIKHAIPEAFLTLVKETARTINGCGGKILLYEKPGWTFHAKGVWITADDDDDDDGCDSQCPEIVNKPSSLLATIIGSGNYGARSEDLDVESNCILVFNEGTGIDSDECKAKGHVAAEWNKMCESSKELEETSVADDSNKFMRLVLEFMKRFL